MEAPSDYSPLNRYEVTHRGSGVAILGLGNFYALACKAAEAYKAKGVDATVVNPRYATGIDEPLLASLLDDHHTVITLEDGQVDGGWGEKVARFYGDKPMKVRCLGGRKGFVDRYSYDEYLRSNGLTVEQIAI